MKFWLLSRNLPNPSNTYRFILSYTLHIRHNYSLLISYTHLSGCQLWLNHPIYTCQQSPHILHLHIPICRMRPTLWILYIPWNIKHWHYPTICSYSNSVYRLHFTMRTNVLLRHNYNYQLTISHPIHWNQPCRVNLRRFSSRQSHLNTILCLPLYCTIQHFGTSSNSSTISSWNNIHQSFWNPIWYGQNSIPPILHN